MSDLSPSALHEKVEQSKNLAPDIWRRYLTLSAKVTEEILTIQTDEKGKQSIQNTRKDLDTMMRLISILILAGDNVKDLVYSEVEAQAGNRMQAVADDEAAWERARVEEKQKEAAEANGVADEASRPEEENRDSSSSCSSASFEANVDAGPADVADAPSLPSSIACSGSYDPDDAENDGALNANDDGSISLAPTDPVDESRKAMESVRRLVQDVEDLHKGADLKFYLINLDFIAEQADSIEPEGLSTTAQDSIAHLQARVQGLRRAAEKERLAAAAEDKRSEEEEAAAAKASEVADNQTGAASERRRAEEERSAAEKRAAEEAARLREEEAAANTAELERESERLRAEEERKAAEAKRAAEVAVRLDEEEAAANRRRLGSDERHAKLMGNLRAEAASCGRSTYKIYVDSFNIFELFVDKALCIRREDGVGKTKMLRLVKTTFEALDATIQVTREDSLSKLPELEATLEETRKISELDIHQSSYHFTRSLGSLVEREKVRRTTPKLEEAKRGFREAVEKKRISVKPENFAMLKYKRKNFLNDLILFEDGFGFLELVNLSEALKGKGKKLRPNAYADAMKLSNGVDCKLDEYFEDRLDPLLPSREAIQSLNDVCHGMVQVGNTYDRILYRKWNKVHMPGVDESEWSALSPFVGKKGQVHARTIARLLANYVLSLHIEDVFRGAPPLVGKDGVRVDTKDFPRALLRCPPSTILKCDFFMHKKDFFSPGFFDRLTANEHAAFVVKVKAVFEASAECKEECDRMPYYFNVADSKTIETMAALK